MAGLRPGQVNSTLDLAEAMGVSRPTIYEWQNKPDFPMPVEGVYSIRAVCEWKFRRDQKAKPRDGDEDPLLGDGESEGLERYRMAKAQLAELDLAEREKEMLPADQVRDGVAAISLAFRQAGETLQRQFGPEAHAILEGAVSEAETQINGMFGIEDEPGDTDTA